MWSKVDSETQHLVSEYSEEFCTELRLISC